jgi:FkbM family methyltransferase
MSFSVKLGHFLYKHAFAIYKPLYTGFKNRQDAFEIRLLQQHIRPGDVVLDIGANIGYYALILSRLVGKRGRVHCFEPDLQNFRHLDDATSAIGNVFINNKAVGSRTESLKIYTSNTLNVDHRTYKPDVYDRELEIQAVSIDDYVQKHITEEGGRVDFIKMDIQGFEMEAVRGMQELLKQNADIKLISEFWPYGLRKAGHSALEYFRFLSDLGFHCYLLEKDTLKKLDEELVGSLEGLEEKHYFNIFASRTDV